jgi:hypothetical protein
MNRTSDGKVAYDPKDDWLVERLNAAEVKIERLTRENETEKRAPVQGYSAGIPWSMHLRAYDVYCKRYGKQDALINLEGRNCRGGFHVGELDEFVPGWREELSEFAKLRAEVERLTRENAAMSRVLSKITGCPKAPEAE